MPSSWMLHRVVLTRTDVSEECISTIIAFKFSSELGTTLRSSETSVLTRATRRNIRQDGIVLNLVRQLFNIILKFGPKFPTDYFRLGNVIVTFSEFLIFIVLQECGVNLDISWHFEGKNVSEQFAENGEG
jgi:hypothetical protein